MPKKKSDNQNAWKLTLPVVFLLVAAIALFNLWSGSGHREEGKKAISESTPAGLQVLSEKNAAPSLSPPSGGEEEHPNVSGNNQPTSPEQQCLSLGTDIEDLFTYLDDQTYIVDYQLPDGTQKYFKNMLSTIFANPPIVPDKGEGLTGTVKNTVHFFRVLGNKNLMLVKDYLAREQGRLEYDFNLFFDWAAHDSCRQLSSVDISLPIENLYQYASFFLTTKGGQSYLLRRSDQIILLVQYYSIRIVDLADARQKNIYDIDLLPPINALLFRLQSENGLEEKADYVATLEKLRQKYLERLRQR